MSHLEQPYLFSRVSAMHTKVNKLSVCVCWGVREGSKVCRGWCYFVDCDTCRSCQDQEEHVGLMTGQRWPGKPDPLPEGGLVYCGFLFSGTKPRCASRRCITSTIPRQATSPPTPPYPIPTSTHALICSQSKLNCWQPQSPVPMATTHKGTALALMILICGDRQRGQFIASRAKIWMQAELSVGH